MTLPADFHLSYSSLQQYLTCPRQWCFQRIDGVKKPVSGALFLGSTVHSALAYHFKNSPVVEETLLFFQQAWKDRSALKEDSWNGFIEWERSEQDLRDLGLELLQLYLKEVVPKLKPVLVEQEFTRSINGVPFIGRLDLVDQSGRVIDYKVKGRFWADPKVRARELALDLQPTAYGFLLGGPIEFCYHFLLKLKIPSLQFQTVKVVKEKIDWFGNQLLPGVVDSITKGAFPANPTTWKCLSLDTQVLTGRGWLSYDEITLMDSILTLNPETQNLEWQPPEKIFVKPCYEPLVVYEGKSIAFSVTADHDVYSRTKNNQLYRKRKASEVLGKGEHIFRVSGSLPRGKVILNQELFGHDKTDDWLALAGWAAAEGHFRRDSVMVEITQKQNTPGHAELEEILNRLQFSYTLKEDSGKSVFRLKPQASQLLRSIQPDKRLPQWLWTAESSQFETWLSAFAKGDANIRGDCYSIAQKDEITIDQLQALAVASNMSAVKSGPFISSTGGKFWKLSVVKNRPEIRIGGSSARKFYRRQEADLVWCVSVPNGLIMTRYEGRPIITGNCSPSWCPYWKICRRQT